MMGSLPPSEEKCHVPGLKINKKPGCRERPAPSDPKELRDPLAPRFQGGFIRVPPPPRVVTCEVFVPSGL